MNEFDHICRYRRIGDYSFTVLIAIDFIVTNRSIWLAILSWVMDWLIMIVLVIEFVVIVLVIAFVIVCMIFANPPVNNM